MKGLHQRRAKRFRQAIISDLMGIGLNFDLLRYWARVAAGSTFFI